MIHLIMIDNRWKSAVRLCRTFQGADIASDHSLVLCNLRLRLKHIRKKQYRKIRNIEMLENPEIRRCFEERISEEIQKARIQEAGIDQRIENINKIILETTEMIIPEKEKANRKWISSETLELAKEKREIRVRMKNSKELVTEYRKLCNRIRIAARKDKQNWIEKKCSQIEKCTAEEKTSEAYRMVKELNRKWQPKLTSIKDEEGKIIIDKEKCRQRWTQYCSELYEDKSEDTGLRLELEMISPPEKDDTEDVILYEEVQQAIKNLKKRKSPGEDGIMGEMITAGGEELHKEIHQICNQIWREGKIPETWTKSILTVLPKKGDLMECKNYRTIALMSHMGKVMMKILTYRLRDQLEEHMVDEQAGFRRDRSTVQQILMLRLIAEKAKRKGKVIYNCFIDFQKAFDSVKQEVIWATMRSYGVGKQLVQTLQNFGEQSKAAVRIDGELGDWFKISIGTKQGDPVSPTEFIGYLERVMDEIQDNGTGISVQGERINNLRFADDVDLLEEDFDTLQKNVEALERAGEKANLKINIGKTKTMAFGEEELENNIKIREENVENVTEFVYLGSLFTSDNNCTKEIRRRINKAKGVLAGFNRIWRSKTISHGTKKRLLETCVFSTALYACETWTLKKEDRQRILAFEMYCYRRILQLNWTQKITNAEVRERINSKLDMVGTIMKRKLQLFGHIQRMRDDRKLKSIMTGIMEGVGRRGRPCREWLQDIEEWCGMDIQEITHKANDRETWKKVVKCAVDTYGIETHG